jgi:hypothetical protein
MPPKSVGKDRGKTARRADSSDRTRLSAGGGWAVPKADATLF